MTTKFLILGGGVFWGFFGGGSADFIFMGARIFLNTCSDSIAKLFRACFCGVSHNYRAICCKMGYRTDVPV